MYVDINRGSTLSIYQFLNQIVLCSHSNRKMGVQKLIIRSKLAFNISLYMTIKVENK
jgi:hypothetical protein